MSQAPVSQSVKDHCWISVEVELPNRDESLEVGAADPKGIVRQLRDRLKELSSEKLDGATFRGWKDQELQLGRWGASWEIRQTHLRSETLMFRDNAIDAFLRKLEVLLHEWLHYEPHEQHFPC